jgi:hypothetical protein
MLALVRLILDGISRPSSVMLLYNTLVRMPAGVRLAWSNRDVWLVRRRDAARLLQFRSGQMADVGIKALFAK